MIWTIRAIPFCANCTQKRSGGPARWRGFSLFFEQRLKFLSVTDRVKASIVFQATNEVIHITLTTIACALILGILANLMLGIKDGKEEK